MERKRGYKYRAYPTKEQQEFFSKNFGCCRFVYNHYLAKRKATWEEWHDTMSFSETSRDLANDLKKEKEWLKEADSSALQQSLRHLDNAYQNFFKKRSARANQQLHARLIFCQRQPLLKQRQHPHRRRSHKTAKGRESEDRQHKIIRRTNHRCDSDEDCKREILHITPGGRGI